MRKLLSMLLALTLVLSCVPVAAAAEQETLPAETAAPVETEAAPTETEAPVETEAEPTETEVQLAEVSFLCNPQDLELHVYEEQSGEEMQPSSGRTYLLEPGFYYLSASCQGFEDLIQAIFEVEQEDLQIPVELKVLEQPAETVPQETVPQETEPVQSQDDVTADAPALNSNIEIYINQPNFPDVIFREEIRRLLDYDGDNKLTGAERLEVTSLDVSNLGITNLQGLEWFPELQFLYCRGNQLTKLDLRDNLKLITVDCRENQISELYLGVRNILSKLYISHNSLEFLDLTRVRTFTGVDCSYNKLRDIELGDHPKLELNISHNNLDFLILNQGQNLTSIDCSYNQIDAAYLGADIQLSSLNISNNKLQTLDLSMNKSLERVDCSHNQLTEVTVGAHPKLSWLDLSNNSLKSLDISQNQTLRTLNCMYNQLTQVTLGSNPELFELNVSCNNLQTLDLSGCTGLYDLACGDNHLTDLDLSACTGLIELSCMYNEIHFLDFSMLPKLKRCSNGENPLYAVKLLPDQNIERGLSDGCVWEVKTPDGRLDLAALPGMELSKLRPDTDSGIIKDGIVNPYGEPEMDFTYGYSASYYETVYCKIHITAENAKPVPLDQAHFPDKVFRTYLQRFDENGDSILSVAEYGSVGEIDLTNQGVTTLKGIENFTRLHTLKCAGNQLTELDLSRNYHLSYLDCSSNKIRKLDLSRHERLSDVDCSYNEIETLDVSSSRHIMELDCSYNHLVSVHTSSKPVYPLYLIASNNYYDCSTPSGTLDLRTLPGFDLSRASNFVGGKVKNGILTPDRPGRTVTYTYQCGKDETAEFEIRVNKLRVPMFQIAGTNMTLGNSLTMHFYVNKADIRADSSYYAEITRRYSDERPDDVRKIPQSQWKSFGKSMYQFSYEGLAAKEMTDFLEVRICYTNGEQASKYKFDSIQDYCMRNIDKQSPMVRTMMVDMLNYGAAAQQQFHYGADYLANNQLTAEQRAWGTASVPMENKQVKGKNYAGCTLKLESRIMMDLYFLNVTEDQYAVLSFRDHTGALHEKNVPYSAMKANGKYHLVTVDEMVLADCGQLVSCKLYNGQGQEVASAVDSPESYCARMGSLGGLFDTIMKFSASAHYYLHNR